MSNYIGPEGPTLRFLRWMRRGVLLGLIADRLSGSEVGNKQLRLANVARSRNIRYQIANGASVESI